MQRCCVGSDAQLQRGAASAVPAGGTEDAAPHHTPLLGVQDHLGLDDPRVDVLHVGHGAVLSLSLSVLGDVTSHLMTSWRT